MALAAPSTAFATPSGTLLTILFSLRRWSAAATAGLPLPTSHQRLRKRLAPCSSSRSPRSLLMEVIVHLVAGDGPLCFRLGHFFWQCGVSGQAIVPPAQAPPRRRTLPGPPMLLATHPTRKPSSFISRAASTGKSARRTDSTRLSTTSRRPSSMIPTTLQPTWAWPTVTTCFESTLLCQPAKPTRALWPQLSEPWNWTTSLPKRMLRWRSHCSGARGTPQAPSRNSAAPSI